MARRERSGWGMTRREVFRLGAAAAAGAAFGPFFHTPGHGQTFNWQRFKGKELYLILYKHPFVDEMVKHIPEFESLTGIKVKYEVLPEVQGRQKFTVEMTAGSGGVDAWHASMHVEKRRAWKSGWFQPLNKFLEDKSLTAPDYDWNDFLDKTRDAMTVEGKLVGPPIQVENVTLMYRKDLFQKYNVKVPTTLDELEAAAKALHGKPMTDDGQPGFGFVSRGKRAAATSMFAGMLHAMGGTWLTPKREPAINSDEAVKAIDMWGRLLRLYGPPGSENNHWYEASSIFSQGKAAMYTDANSLWTVIEDKEKSEVIGKVGYALFPKGPKGQSGSTVAVWGLGMPKGSKNQKAAWLFMQWATNKDQVFKVQSEKGVLGCRDSVWKDAKGKARVPADLAESLAQGSKVGTPLWNPPVVAVAEVRDAVGAAIVTSIQGGNVKAAAEQEKIEVLNQALKQAIIKELQQTQNGI